MAAIAVGIAVAVPVIRGGGPDHPEAWNGRVLELVRFVERERSLDFRHPVSVDFLSPEEFRTEVTTDEAELSEEERRELDALEAAFRALGLIEGNVDLFEQANTLSGEATLAFYDFDRQRVFVRGDELSPARRGTLVHELTHVLQDQHFDLSPIKDEKADSGEAAALRALVEGDAQRIEATYVQSLPDDQAAQYEQEMQDEQEAADIEGVPPIFQALFGAPYALGQSLIALLQAAGDDEVDHAFREPPRTEEHLLDPFTFLEGDDPLDTRVPELESAEKEIQSGDFGALTWFLVLAERIDPRQALQAVDGWGGDAYMLYESDSGTCLRLAFRGDDDAQSEEMESALREWTHAMTQGTVDLGRSGDTVTLRSCDPGPEVTLEVKGISGELLLIPVTRAFFGAGFLEAGWPRSLAQCAAGDIVGRLSVAQLLTLEELFATEEPPQEVLDVVPEAFEACGAPVPGG